MSLVGWMVHRYPACSAACARPCLCGPPPPPPPSFFLNGSGVPRHCVWGYWLGFLRRREGVEGDHVVWLPCAVPCVMLLLVGQEHLCCSLN
jgi:hypothetical protein